MSTARPPIVPTPCDGRLERPTPACPIGHVPFSVTGDGLDQIVHLRPMHRGHR